MDHLKGRRPRRGELSIRPANTADLSSFDLRQTAAGVASGLGSDRFVVPAKYRFGQLIIIGADVAGRAVTAFLDSGSQSTVGNLAQLGDDLFRLVVLPCHRSIHPKWSSDQHKGWITSRGSDQPLLRVTSS